MHGSMPLFNTKKCSAIRVGGEDEVKCGGSDQEVVREEVEVLGSQSGNGYSSVNDGNRRQKEGTSGPTPTNKETLRGIDAAISKYDKTEVDLQSNGHTSILGCVLSEDEDMLTIKSPQGNEYKARGWKRLVSDRPYAEDQITPMQRKRAVCDEEDEMEVEVLKKKFCAFDTT